MPIYAYKCASCGHADDVLQKLADAPLTVCPKCGKESYSKQITAPQFQLKGSGWYVTDFRGGNSSSSKKEGDSAGPVAEAKSESSTGTPSESKTDSASTSKSEPAKTAAPSSPAA